MKKRIFQAAAATGLSVVMAASSLAAIAPVSVLAADEETTDEETATPFWSVSFNNGYDDLQTDENFEVVENGATPELVEDEYNGETIQVLELKESTGDEVYTENYSGGTIFAGYTDNSTIKLSNPFASLGENYFRESWYSEEYDFLEDDDKHIAKYNGIKMPAWENGATLSYWIKVPSNGTTNDYGETVGVSSSIFTWELQDYQYQVDDYAKYLGCKAAKEEIAENEANGTETNESGVTADSFYYFEYQRDADGNIVMYESPDGSLTGPVYATLGKSYYCNPNYQPGFTGTDESNYTTPYPNENYCEEGYDTLATITQTYEDVTTEGKKTYQAADGDSWDVGTSTVRFARTHSVLQIDADSSILWNNDDSFGHNLNTNVMASFGTRGGMQNADCFFMNSWQESTVTDSFGGTASSAKYLADSPYSQPDEWHLVTITLMNDWVEFYLDGECVDVESSYSSRGATGLDNSESFKRLNKGMGLRGHYGSEKKTMGCIGFYGNYVARLFLDWLTNENSTFTIGGVTTTNGQAAMYNMSTKTDEVKIAAISAYSVVLDDDQIKAEYEAGIPTGSSVLYGDVDEDTDVDASDALLTLQAVVKLTTLSDSQTTAADVDGTDGVTANDALLILQKVVKLIDTFPVEK